MFRHFPLVALALPGCIIYDDIDRCKGGDCTDEEAWDDEGDEVAPEPSFTVDPSEATAGTTFIATVTAENFDLATVESVEVFGSASLLAQQNRGAELILTVSVDQKAALDEEVDILLHVGNDVVLIEAALTVTAEAATGGADDCD